MDQVVGQALAAFKRLQKRHEEAASPTTILASVGHAPADA
jgi:hypothetical protein